MPRGGFTLRRGEVGRLVLGVVSTAKYFAPRLVRALMDAVPGPRSR